MTPCFQCTNEQQISRQWTDKDRRTTVTLWRMRRGLIMYTHVMYTWTSIIFPFRVAVTRSHDIPYFGPEIPDNAVFDKNQNFREFILTKCMYIHMYMYVCSDYLLIQVCVYVCVDTLLLGSGTDWYLILDFGVAIDSSITYVHYMYMYMYFPYWPSNHPWYQCTCMSSVNEFLTWMQLSKLWATQLSLRVFTLVYYHIVGNCCMVQILHFLRIGYVPWK